MLHTAERGNGRENNVVVHNTRGRFGCRPTAPSHVGIVTQTYMHVNMTCLPGTLPKPESLLVLTPCGSDWKMCLQ